MTLRRTQDHVRHAAAYFDGLLFSSPDGPSADCERSMDMVPVALRIPALYWLPWTSSIASVSSPSAETSDGKLDPLLLAGPTMFLVGNWRPRQDGSDDGGITMRTGHSAGLSDEDVYASTLLAAGSQLNIIEGGRRSDGHNP